MALNFRIKLGAIVRYTIITMVCTLFLTLLGLSLEYYNNVYKLDFELTRLYSISSEKSKFFLSELSSALTDFRKIAFYFLSGSIVIFVIIGFLIALMYLQTGPKSKKTAPKNIEFVDESTGTTISSLKKIYDKIDLQNNRLDHIENKFENIELNPNKLSEEKTDELVSAILKKIKDNASQEYLSEVRELIKSEEQENYFLKDLMELHDNVVRRIDSELEALSRRGNLNLVLGIFTAVAGIMLLGYFVISSGSYIGRTGLTFQEFISSFIPNISLVLIVEVFAYFFLRLYSTSLAEIKYFQNELTNVQAKFSALKSALHLSDDQASREVILQLSRTERNFIISKRQTTADLERSKIENRSFVSLVAAIMGGSRRGFFDRRQR